MKGKSRKSRVGNIIAAIVVMAVIGGIGICGVYIYNSTQEKKEFREQGIDAYEAGSYEEAIAAFQVSLDARGTLSAPLDRDSRLYLADCYFLLGRYQEAIEQYDILLKTEEAQVDYLKLQKTVSQGFIDFNNKDFEAALPAFEEALNAGHTECALYAGVCAAELDRENEMVAYFTTYLNYNPDSAYACVELADYYLNQKLYDTCRQYIDMGYAVDDRSCDEQLMWTELVYYEYQKDYNKAYQLIEKYMENYEVTDTVQREYDFLATRQTLE
jgi:tetratricopeptide (TPR) repeat protein